MDKQSKNIGESGIISKIHGLFIDYNHNRKISRGPSPGLYYYTISDDGDSCRVHLRIEPTMEGFLLINASRIMHLNPTAVLMAYFYLEKVPTHIALREMTLRYNIAPARIRQDYQDLTEKIDQIIQPNNTCLIHDIDLEVVQPFSSRPSAPYRMDIALTYRCNNDCAHCYNARPRIYPELDSDKWKIILDKLWDIGIPHIVFTGGEPTLYPDLPGLISYAEKKGQITGINTNGRRLKDPEYVKKLVDSGLDHVQITVESHLPKIHDEMVLSPGAWKQTISGLEQVLDTPLYVMTNTTLLRPNSRYLRETIEFLADLGVSTIGLNALIYSGHGLTIENNLTESELIPLLTIAREITDKKQQRLIWYSPTQYCHFDPMQLELGVKGCTAALYNMCLEPDGKVLPCQSYYNPLGNILSDPWVAIWEHELARSLRERQMIDEKCKSCVLLTECGGGCPLNSS